MAAGDIPAADAANCGGGSRHGAAAALQHPLSFRLLPTGAPTGWDPASAEVTLNVRLDGCIVPSEASPEGARIAYSHAVVIDDFVDEPTRQQLLNFLLHGSPSSPASCTAGDSSEGSKLGGTGGTATQRLELGATDAAGPPAGPPGAQGFDPELTPGRWERRTADMAGGAPTWGVKQHVLAELAAGSLPAMQEVHARLLKLYPECDIAHLPSDAIQLQPAAMQHQAGREQPAEQGAGQQQTERKQHQQQQEAGQQPAELRQQQQVLQQQEQADMQPTKRSRVQSGSTGSKQPAVGTEHANGEGGGARQSAQAGVDCACFVANAAVEGDSFRFHVDADPTSFPDGSPWHAAYGDYFNGEPGRPLLVSLLLYLNPEWERDWGGDTLFLDGATDTGVFVTPKPRRAVLFDQDVMHRVSAPLASASGRPRFSLVWKLAFLPRQPGQALCLARPEWGPPVSIGSAARVDAVKRRLTALLISSAPLSSRQPSAAAD